MLFPKGLSVFSLFVNLRLSGTVKYKSHWQKQEGKGLEVPCIYNYSRPPRVICKLTTL